MRLGTARLDPELGLEKRCNVCGDWWPLDEEFWYFQTFPAGSTYTTRGRTYVRKTEVRHVYSRCRACWADRSAAQHVERVSRARARYNGAVGSSDESNILSRGARVSATTRDAGVIASIEVVAR